MRVPRSWWLPNGSILILPPPDELVGPRGGLKVERVEIVHSGVTIEPAEDVEFPPCHHPDVPVSGGGGGTVLLHLVPAVGGTLGPGGVVEPEIVHPAGPVVASKDVEVGLVEHAGVEGTLAGGDRGGGGRIHC